MFFRLLLVLFSFLINTFAIDCFADEVTLKNGQKVQYKSIYSIDKSGITLEIENGLKVIDWAEIEPEDARKIDKEIYEKVLPEIERKEIAEKARIEKELKDQAEKERIEQEKKKQQEQIEKILKEQEEKERLEKESQEAEKLRLEELNSGTRQVNKKTFWDINLAGILIFIGILCAILGIFLIKSRIKIFLLQKKYSRIIDVDGEREKILKEIKKISDDRDRIKTEFASKRDKLTADYDKAHEIYEKLLKEISLLEESLEMSEFGIYKPHFDYDTSEEFRHQLELLQEKEKEMIRSGRAVECGIAWHVGGSRTRGQKMTKQINKLMLRAFNGECDAALAKVRWDNITKMEMRIQKAFEIINKMEDITANQITKEFLELKLKELQLTYEYQEKIKQEKDEQREIQEAMREEERARREIEKAKEEAEKEEARYQKALEKAREEAQQATGEQLNKLDKKVKELEAQLKAAQELKERAISRAQITKSGHVYIISNVGSFGENVLKIGMTRRFEPFDRIRELSDASVPFSFDVHGMIYSENAPELESRLHKHFETTRINLVNERKEFFSVSIGDIENWAKNSGLDLKLTKLAEAREYRETLAIRAKGKDTIIKSIEEKVPSSIDSLFKKDEE